MLEKHTHGLHSFTCYTLEHLFSREGWNSFFKRLVHTKPTPNLPEMHPILSLFFIHCSFFSSSIRVISKTPLIAKYIGFVPHNVVSEALAIALKLEKAWRVKCVRWPATLEMGKLADTGWGITYTTHILNQDVSFTRIWLWQRLSLRACMLLPPSVDYSDT